MARLKRKARLEDEYDSDEIRVASKSEQQHRHPLKEIRNDAIQTVPVSNKRRRVLDCVLIPQSRTTANSNIHNELNVSKGFHSSSSRPRLVDSSKRPQQRKTTAPELYDPLAKSRSSHVLITTKATRPRDDQSIRPRRTVSRPSYVLEVAAGDDSPDELTSVLKRPKKKTAARARAPSLISDFEEPSDHVSSTAISSEDGDDTDGTSSSEGNSTESDNAVPPSRSKIQQQQPPSKGRSTLKKAQAVKGKTASSNMRKLLSRGKGQPKGLDLNLPPLSDIHEIFSDITSRAIDFGFEKVLKHLNGRPLRVATMCSGTESPLLALQMVQSAVDQQLNARFKVEHLFSAEIVAYKQAYIDRNFNPPLIFRDIVELISAVDDEIPMATTAFGGKAVVPLNADIVIAGTSCVDVSRLNNHRKDFTEGGESGDTWNAVLAYCRKSRPPIVILENIKGAPWDDMLHDYEAAGYETAGVLVDTKDFYIPQTRQRGYMVCFDAQKLKDAQATGAGTRWQELMNNFKRPASSPASSFLILNDQIVARKNSHFDDPKRDVGWPICKLTQLEYRLKKRLGEARPLTNWNEDGSRLPPDHGSRSWYKDQVERVLDTLDVSLLRKALPKNASKNGNYDVRFKTRIQDLSQNVYRDEDTTPFGIAPCITPSARNFISDAGRPLLSEESLMVQGLPLNSISFTTETATEVQNLAGNAMSTTPVGCGNIAALVAGYRILDPGLEPKPDLQPSAIPNALKLEEGSSRYSSMASSLDNVDASGLLPTLEMATRKCYCEGRHNIANDPIQQCVDCGHTTCTACGGNPQHNYRLAPELSRARKRPEEVEAKLRSMLPLRVKLDHVDEKFVQTLTKEAGNGSTQITDYLDLLKRGAKETFTLSSFRRTQSTIMTYQASLARLEFVMEDHRMEWRLYVLPPSGLASNHSLRQQLAQPVAVSVVSDWLFGNPWSWRIPCVQDASVTVQGHGAKLPSWLARLQLPDFTDQVQWEYLTFSFRDQKETFLKQRIEGTYAYRPACGTANESLYVKTELDAEGRQIYLFLDPDRLGDPEEDSFVFSTNISRLEYQESRPRIASIPSWKPWEQPQSEKRAILRASDVWVETHGIGKLRPLQTRLGVLLPKDISKSARDAGCDQAIAIISFDGPVETALPVRRIEASIVSIDNQRFLAQYSWIFEELRRHELFNQWQSFNHPDAASRCSKCAPPQPRIRWELEHGKDIVPYPDAVEATAYERALKQRSEQVVIEAHPVQSQIMRLSLGINLLSLAHRAFSRLPKDAKDISFKWKICATTTTPGQAARFELKSTQNETLDNRDLECSLDLFPAQRTALSWMKAQETGAGQKCMLEESVEELVPHLGLRVEMRAIGYKYARAGICADNPGFGKTMNTLALIQSRFLDNSTDEILAELKSRQSGPSKGLFPSSATLIVQPKTLQGQWMDEIQDKLGYTTGVIAIPSLIRLARLSMNDIKHAKIICVDPALLVSEIYNERLGALAGLPPPSVIRGRAFTYWLNAVMEAVPKHLQIWDTAGIDSLRETAAQEYRRFFDDEALIATVPSRRLVGRDYVSAAKRSKTARSSKAVPAGSHPQEDSVGTPLLHMFYWDRIVIDEFHQYSDPQLAALQALRADKRWGLSGTPAMDDCYDIARTASLLGITLRTGSASRGNMKVKNINNARRDMTSTELFDTMRQKRSPSVEERIRKVSQNFLDSFIRRNVEKFEWIEYEEILVPVKLRLGHQALYTELLQDSVSKNMSLQKTSRSRTSDRDVRIHNALDTCKTVEEALSKAVAFHELPQRGASSKMLTSPTADIEHLTDLRQAEREHCLQALLPAIVDAQANESETFTDWKHTNLQLNALGDSDAITAIQGFCNSENGQQTPQAKGAKSARKKKKKTKQRIQPESGSATNSPPAKPKSKIEGSRDLTSKVDTLATNLVVINRSLRFLNSMQAVRTPAKAVCAGVNCYTNISQTTPAVISANCGHIMCNECYNETISTDKASCPAEGCAATVREHNLCWTAKLRDLANDACSPYGAKMEAVVNILRIIEQQGEQAILFVQYKNELSEMAKALQHYEIAAVVVTDLNKAGQQVKNFRTSASAGKKQTVLVLNQSDETAAGLNIQNANHVIFFAPLLRETQYAYDATMTQAIGRIRRHGQTRKLHVWRIVALDTIDVDILEHRERRTTALVEQNAPRIKPPKAATKLSIDKSPESTQLVRELDKFSLRPRSWLVKCGVDNDADEMARVRGKDRVAGWGDHSSRIKFSEVYTENDN